MPKKINLTPSQSGRVWFIQNTHTEGPGYFGHLLKLWKIPFRICHLEKGDPLPPFTDCRAVILLGGPMSANDRTETMLSLLKWIRGLLRKGIPCLGICLGLQTLVKAAGGRVVKNPVKEIGLKMRGRMPFVCVKTKAADKDPLLRELSGTFPIFQLHGETVKLKKGMTLLAEGEWCKNQIVKIRERVYGLQGHLELTRELLRVWLREDEDLRLVNARVLLKQFDAVQKELQGNCRKIFFSFLNAAGLIS